MPSILGNKIEI